MLAKIKKSMAKPTVALPVSPAPSPAVTRPAHPDTTPARPPTIPPRPDTRFALPKLRLEVRDATHAGAHTFFSSLHVGTTLASAAHNVLRLLYKSPGDAGTCPPPTRSVTLILRDMSGVAYTTGTELDNDHKEIHFALSHAAGAAAPGPEITGVITHELVHCLQWNAAGTCPGGLVEGVADWVRLRCGLAPSHWKKDPDANWDAGYQHTAYFLDYLEGQYGDGFVRALNEKLRVDKYHEDQFWTGLTGKTVDVLHKGYVEQLRKKPNGS